MVMQTLIWFGLMFFSYNLLKELKNIKICARRIATVHLDGDILPTKNSAELHVAFGLEKFFAPQLEYAIALE